MIKYLAILVPSLSALSVNLALATEATIPPMIVSARFSFNEVRERAAQLAKQAYHPEVKSLPAGLEQLDYDDYRNIRFNKEQSIFLKDQLPFIVRFFHRGYLFTTQVKMNIIDKGSVVAMPYNKAFYNFGQLKFSDPYQNQDIGYAGFQLLYPLHRENKYDEIAAFLGASYFRAIGKEQNYGLSARGLAVDTGLPRDEEFPDFREYWIEKPTENATSIVIYALLDSKSVTGAYRFVITPGVDTVFEVKATVFARQNVEKVGFAPITSMFYYGENTEQRPDDFRPEVHDSDGLLMLTGNNEWIWRPLINPHYLRINAYLDNNPKGFGLLQRDRDFSNYQDLVSVYHTRPGLWIEPMGEWGKGHVQLLEIPADAERMDNIGAFWVPEKPLTAGDEISLEYRMSFLNQEAKLHKFGQVLSTHVGRGGSDSRMAIKRKFVIDFVGSVLQDLPEDAPVKSEVTLSNNAKLTGSWLEKNPYTRGYRAFFEIMINDSKPVDLHAMLRLNKTVLTETWSYQWQ